MAQPVIAYPPRTDEQDGLTTAQLMSRFTEQASRLVRDELELAKVEMTAKAKSAGFGAGALGGAGVMAFYGGGCLLAAAIVALALVMPAWAAALIVGVAVLLAAGISALIGRKSLRSAVPNTLPGETIEGLRTDVRTVREHAKP